MMIISLKAETYIHLTKNIKKHTETQHIYVVWLHTAENLGKKSFLEQESVTECCKKSYILSDVMITQRHLQSPTLCCFLSLIFQLHLNRSRCYCAEVKKDLLFFCMKRQTLVHSTQAGSCSPSTKWGNVGKLETYFMCPPPKYLILPLNICSPWEQHY